MTDIAHEMKVRPARVFAGDVKPYVLLSPQERDDAVAEIERLRSALSQIADGDAFHDGAPKFMQIARDALQP
jgi:hypothetical protein